MPRRARSHEITVNLFLNRANWQKARYLNQILGPAFTKKGMNEFVNMLLGRYVHAQLNDPATKALLESYERNAAEQASHASAHLVMKDADVPFWKGDNEKGDFSAATTGRPATPRT